MKKRKFLKTVAIVCLVIALTRSLFPLSPPLDIRETVTDMTGTAPSSFFDDFSTGALKVKYEFESLTNYVKAPLFEGSGSYDAYKIEEYETDEEYYEAVPVGEVDRMHFVDRQGGLVVSKEARGKSLLEFLARISDLLEDGVLLVWEFVKDIFEFMIYWFKISIKFIFGR